MLKLNSFQICLALHKQPPSGKGRKEERHMKKIFVSYSRVDTEKVDRLATRLREEAHDVSIDRKSIQGGDIWTRRLVEEIERADVILACLSTSSVRSDNVRRELQLALDAKKTILPVMLETTVIPSELKYQLAGLQMIDFVADFEVGLQELLQQLGAEEESLRSAECQLLKAEIFGLPIYQEMQGAIRKVETDQAISAENRECYAVMYEGGYLDKLRVYLENEKAKIDEKMLGYFHDSELKRLEYRKEAIEEELIKIKRRYDQTLQKSKSIVEAGVERTRKLWK